MNLLLVCCRIIQLKHSSKALPSSVVACQHHSISGFFVSYQIGLSQIMGLHLEGSQNCVFKGSQIQVKVIQVVPCYFFFAIEFT